MTITTVKIRQSERRTGERRLGERRVQGDAECIDLERRNHGDFRLAPRRLGMERRVAPA